MGKKQNRLSQEQWATIQAKYEVGHTQSALAREFRIGRRTVGVRIKKGNWTQDQEAALRARAMEKAAGIPPAILGKARNKEFEEEAERRAAVILRHRREINNVRERLYEGLKMHKEAKGLAGKRLAFEYLKSAKISAEALQIVQRLERKAHGLDNPEEGAGTINITLSQADARL